MDDNGAKERERKTDEERDKRGRRETQMRYSHLHRSGRESEEIKTQADRHTHEYPRQACPKLRTRTARERETGEERERNVYVAKRQEGKRSKPERKGSGWGGPA